ncbi:MAG: hypothetical protein JO340_05895 [Acidobacteriaceae bacterium]|nr:hypothetical protein [Acidobacteriaceae bacterium]
MHPWRLKIEINGEWEECDFPTQNDALSAFVALAEDYKGGLKRAVLFARAAAFARILPAELPFPDRRSLN